MGQKVAGGGLLFRSHFVTINTKFAVTLYSIIISSYRLGHGDKCNVWRK